MSQENGSVVNKMSRAQCFKAARWLETNWEKLKGMTRVEAGRELATHVGLKEISPQTVTNLLKDMGRTWPGKNARTGGKSSGHSSNRTRFIAGQLLRAKRCLDWLAMQYGTDIPDNIALNEGRLRTMQQGSSPETGTGDGDENA